MNKRAVELALNTIVIASLAMLVLVVGVFIIRKIIPITDDIPDLEPPFMAHRDNPLVMPHTKIPIGKSEDSHIDFYNTEVAKVTDNSIPTITCANNPDISMQAVGITVQVNEGKRYYVTLKAEEGTPPTAYPCTVTISETQAQTIITVG